MFSAAKTAAVCASLSTISLGSYSLTPRPNEEPQTVGATQRPTFEPPSIMSPGATPAELITATPFSDKQPSGISNPYPTPLRTAPNNWGLDPQGAVTAVVLVAAILTIARVSSARRDTLPLSGSSSTGRPGWGTALAKGLSELLRGLQPSRQIEMPPINAAKFIDCALEVERFNQLNRDISGVNSDLSAVNRHGIADTNHELSYYEAIKKGWELFLEERGFGLVETLWEKGEGDVGRTIMHARLDFVIQDPARAALALQLLIPESYVRKVPPGLALLIRRLEDSCIRFALTEVCASNSIWDFKQLGRELEELRVGFLGLSRRSVAEELQFFNNLIKHDRALFKDLCIFEAVIRNEELEGKNFWVAPSKLETALKIAESTHKKIRPYHELERLTLERMTIGIRDALDLCKVEQEGHYLNEETDGDGGTAVANEPPKRVELYTSRALVDFESRLRAITLPPLVTTKSNRAGDSTNQLRS